MSRSPRRTGRSGRRCDPGTRRTPPADGRRTAAGSRAGRPRPRRLGCGAQASCRGITPSLDLTLEPTLTHHVPALVVATAVLVEIGLGRLVRCVRRTERQVGEERAIGAHALVVVDHQQQLIDQVFGEVVALLGGRRRIDVGVVARPAPGGTDRSHPAGTRRSVRTLDPAATGRTGPPRRCRVPGVRCHLPAHNVAYPSSRSTSATVAAAFEMWPSWYAGNPSASPTGPACRPRAGTARSAVPLASASTPASRGSS